VPHAVTPDLSDYRKNGFMLPRLLLVRRTFPWLLALAAPILRDRLCPLGA
jgi:hypothetical protein